MIGPPKMLDRLPRFDLDGYRELIDGLRWAGFSVEPVGRMPEGQPDVVYLRHDVDFDLQAAAHVAELEGSMGVRSTYYVLLSQHYNPMQRENRSALRRLVELGHEIGLHYDLVAYPDDPPEALERLRWEVDVLSGIVEAPVRTISRHQPSVGGFDPFQTLGEHVHPHDPRNGVDLLYVSDSCREWRDASLLRAWAAERPRRILLNTHPELWLDASILDRMAYLDWLGDVATGRYRDLIGGEVRERWLARSGPASPDGVGRTPRFRTAPEGPGRC